MTEDWLALHKESVDVFLKGAPPMLIKQSSMQNEEKRDFNNVREGLGTWKTYD